MKRISALIGLVLIGFFYQNCAQPEMSFDHTDPASALGITLTIVPDANNINEIENTQKYTVEVKLPEKGEIQRENISINGTRVQYEKNALGNYQFSFVPGSPTLYKILAEVWTPTGAHFEVEEDLKIVDERPPVIKIVPDVANRYEDLAGATQKFSVEVKDEGGGQIVSVKCFIDATETDCTLDSSGKGLIVATNARGGLHSLYVDAIDNSGNARRQPHAFSIGADLIAPVVTLQEDATNTYYTIDPQKFNIGASDAHTGLRSVLCTVNSKAVSTCPPITGGSVVLGLTSTQLVEGLNTISVRALDNAVKNNVSSPNETVITRSFHMLVDREAPTIKLTKLSSNTNLVNQVQKVAFEVADSGSGLKNGSLICKVNGTAQTCQMNASGIGEISYLPTAPGAVVVEVSAADRYNNAKTESTTLDIVRDANVPVVTITAHTSNPAIILVGSTVRFNFTVAKEGTLSTLTSVRCYSESAVVNCNAAADLKSGSISTSFAATGRRTVRVEATDSTGNVGQKTYEVGVYKLASSTTSLAVNEIKAVDVLIVIDDSASMKVKQANMAQRISSFTSKLSALDWRAGIITTDIVDPEKMGKLRPIIGAANGVYWVSKATPNAQKLIGDTVQGAGIAGAGQEQGIKAANLMISNKENAPNKGFFRNNAALAILFISDENESANTVQNRGATLVDLVQSLWPAKPFRAHSIVQLPNDVCPGGKSIGVRYTELSGLTNGQVGCVTDADYGPTLASMGQSSAESVNAATLTCEPYNRQIMITQTNGTAVNVGYTISGRNVTFNSNLPIGQFNISYSCVQQ